MKRMTERHIVKDGECATLTLKCSIQEAISKLAKLEDKLENGTLIEFPRIVPPIKYNNYSLWSVEYVNRAYGNISTDFYGTKEDAEERLKELQGE